METLWFWIVSVMIAVYVVLDGYDLGAGILHLFIGKSNSERQQILSAIGPFWNGNEVWLLAGGGLLVFAFPKVYAAGFSGFYLPLMMVLWLLVLRGLSVEFRSKESNELWRTFWDTTFASSSIILAIVLGAALGNVIRGVPLTGSGYFDGALFTNFQPGRMPGVLDWYTVSVGVFALLVLAAHGSQFLYWKCSGALQRRAKTSAKFLWLVILIIGVVVTAMTNALRPELYHGLIANIWCWPLPMLILIGLAGVLQCQRKNQELLGFLGSSLFIAALLAATAAGMYPNMLISTLDPKYTLTVANSAIGANGLQNGLIWWIPTVILAIIYFANLYRTFRGKVDAESVYDH